LFNVKLQKAQAMAGRKVGLNNILRSQQSEKLAMLGNLQDNLQAI
jgi:hypothetical protein